MQVQPLTLTGELVRLEPLSLEHASDLFRSSRDPSIWRFLASPSGPPNSEEAMRRFIELAVDLQRHGTHLPFAVALKASGRAVGSTRYLDIQPAHRGLEIGGTWYAPEVQRTAVNTECKYLLLRHAFETLGCVRVQFKTDRRNERSQRAIERIGGVREGILRRHMILHDGYVRDSVYYSIIDQEWPAVRAHLEVLLRRGVPTFGESMPTCDTASKGDAQ